MNRRFARWPPTARRCLSKTVSLMPSYASSVCSSFRTQHAAYRNFGVSFERVAARRFVLSRSLSERQCGAFLPTWSVAISQSSASTLHLSFALADQKRLEQLLAHAGFRDVSVELQTREDSFESFDDYWVPIEAGTGSLPQAYLARTNAKRHEVREEVRARLSKYESHGRLSMSVEMLIGSGRA
jgi:hypothetical protein